MKLALKPIICGALLGAISSAHATVILFCGIDPVSFANDPRPNSNASFAQFAVVAGSQQSISVANFDSLANQTLNGPVASNMSMTSTNVDTISGGIESNDDVILGFNTSPSAGKHYRMWSDVDTSPAVVDFSFSEGINAFGAFFTGVGTSTGIAEIEWTNSQGVQKLVLNGLPNGSVMFCGFIDQGELFNSVRVQILPPPGAAIDDVFGIDDVVYSNCNPVPEPATMLALAAGASALLRRRRK